MRVMLVVLAVLLGILSMPATSAHPVTDCEDHVLAQQWVEAWSRDPIDEDEDGLHMFNSAACVDMAHY